MRQSELRGTYSHPAPAFKLAGWPSPVRLSVRSSVCFIYGTQGFELRLAGEIGKNTSSTTWEAEVMCQESPRFLWERRRRRDVALGRRHGGDGEQPLRPWRGRARGGLPGGRRPRLVPEQLPPLCSKCSHPHPPPPFFSRRLQAARWRQRGRGVTAGVIVVWGAEGGGRSGSRARRKDGGLSQERGGDDQTRASPPRVAVEAGMSPSAAARPRVRPQGAESP